MAKAKKSVLQAMSEPVTEDEINIHTPPNCGWARLIQLYSFIDYRGKTPQKTDEGIPLVTAKNVRKGYLDYSIAEFISREEYAERQSRGISHRGDILFTTEAPMGNVAIADLDVFSAGQRVITFQKYPHTDWLENRFYYYYFLCDYFQRELDRQKTGSTVAGIKAEKLMRFPVPVPPLPEQHRIVTRIESLFAKLDEAREKAQAVVDGFEGMKQSFLYQAFRGYLTEKWRKENSIDKDQTWKSQTLQSVCVMKITDGTHKTPTYCDADVGIPFISAKDVTSGVICWDNIKYIIPELHEELYERLTPQVDDVLLAKNGTTGVAAIVEEEKLFDLYVTLAVLRPNKDIIVPRYLLNVVNSPICKRQFDEHLTGIGVPNLHLRDIKEVEIPLPSINEQKEIIHIIDFMSEKWSETQAAAEIVLDRIDTMKKSILASAFRGELGTNDPEEESAVELVRRLMP